MPLFAFYVVVLTLGILSMGFQMLGSRLLSPHFGSAIDVWACLISTFLAAFSFGSMAGGAISNLEGRARRRYQIVCAVAALSTFSPQCVQYLAQRGVAPGKASGLVYGVSTLGNIAGVMLTTFVLIPIFPVSTLLYIWLAVAVLTLAALLRFLRTSSAT